MKNIWGSRAMKLFRTLLLALSCSAIAMLAVCSKDEKDIELRLPASLKGVVRLVADSKQGVPAVEDSRRILIQVPANGVVRLDRLSYFDGWHSISFEYGSGPRLKDERDAPIPGKVQVFSLGSSWLRGEEMVYFIGTPEEFARIDKMKIFHDPI